MSLTNLSTSLSAVSMALFAVILLSIFIWILIRKRRHRVWLPTLRLIQLESTPLPKLRVVRPPLIYFLCFLLCALTILFLSSKPHEVKYRETTKKNQKTHIFIDLSPSTQVFPRAQWHELITEVFNYYKSYGIVSVSTSRSQDILSFSSLEELQSYISSLKPHRYGIKLGRVLRGQLEKGGPIDRLIVLSDKDKNSWSDFNWQLLAHKIEILQAHPDISTMQHNIFIDNIEKIGSFGDINQSWRLAISRNYNDKKSSGTVSLKIGQETIRRLMWEIPEGENLINLEVVVPRKVLEERGIVFKEDAIVWELSSSGPDILKEDNIFRSYVQASRQDVFLVANPQGEMFLDDPAHHLKTALEVLGFRVHRRDKITDEESYLNMPLWIIWGGQEPISEYCPSIWANRQKQNTPAVENMIGNAALPMIWLMPANLSPSYENLCHCYSRLIEDGYNKGQKPEYCKELETRDQYISVLRSLGAQQVGGHIDNIMGSWAWHRKRPERKSEVLAFTVPLKPSRSVGVSHDMIPGLTKLFIGFSHLLAKQGEAKVGHWPRFNGPIPEDQMEQSNVPRAESLLMAMPAASLPSHWQKNSTIQNQTKSGANQESDPRDWIQLCFWLIASILIFESIWIIGKSLINNNGRNKGPLVLLFLIMWGFDTKGHGSVSLNLIGYDYQEHWGRSLARDVSGRTSIEVEDTLQLGTSIGHQNLASAWMWLKSSDYLFENGTLRTDIANWIKRGGFLVIENIDPLRDLERIQLLGVKGHWQAIPPDHELMRSFHLLDSLPRCKGNVWQGYHFDGRLAIVGVPFSFLDTLIKNAHHNSCDQGITRERATRIFVNILMVALATDYKKDQIHLPEILKRLR